MSVDIIHKFEETYGREADIIFRFCLTRVYDRQQALDITQETFMRFWKNMQEAKKIKNDRAFLFTVARNLIIDWYRKKKSFSLEKIMNDDKEILIDMPQETAEEVLDVGAEGRYLLGKMNELEPSYRDPLYLRFVEGLSPPEIGAILGVSANAASARINRALSTLRKRTGYI